MTVFALSGNKEEKRKLFCLLLHCKNYKVIYYLLSGDLPLFMSFDFFLFAEVKKKIKVVPWSLNYMSNFMCFVFFIKYYVKSKRHM